MKVLELRAARPPLAAHHRRPSPLSSSNPPPPSPRRWSLEGLSVARQCLLTRGLLPVLGSPGPDGDAVLESAIISAARQHLVRPNRHVVCVQQVREGGFREGACWCSAGWLGAMHSHHRRTSLRLATQSCRVYAADAWGVARQHCVLVSAC